MDVQDQAETTQNVVVATQDGVDMKFNSAELLLSIDELSRRYIDPAVSVLVAGIEGDMLDSVTKDVFNEVGTHGTVVGVSADISAITDARAKLNQNLAPKDQNRSVQFDSVTMGSIVNGTQAFFHDGKQIAEGFREGFIGRNAMATFFENEKTLALTTGTDHTTVDVDGVPADGATTLVTAGGSSVVGQVLTIAGVKAVHPETKIAYQHDQQFVITVHTSDTSWEVSPAMILTGAKQNISVLPALNDVVTLLGATTTSFQKNLMYHKDAFTFVTADLPIMDDGIRCVRRVQDGLSIRCWQGSDIRNDELLLRLDILYGFKTLRPEWACRITN